MAHKYRNRQWVDEHQYSSFSADSETDSSALKGPLNIRKAKHSDIQAIEDLHSATLRKVNIHDYSQDQIETWIASKMTERLERGIASGCVIVCVNERDQILGYAARVGSEIHGLYVSADHLRSGIGSALLSKMEEDARSEGVKEFLFHSTLTATPFYLSKGYEEIGRDDWPIGNGKALRTVKLKKVL